MSSRRQQQVANEVRDSLSQILLRQGDRYYGRDLVTITRVSITPDLLTARVYLSIMQTDRRESVIRALNEHVHEIRKALGAAVKNQFRRVPELTFFLDDSLDEVFRIESLLKEIRDKKE
jgi:ribosome-binding factor A